ncbi:DUF3048 domain-containing protein [Candidatus Saccharibacteria bacterium]|nr:DUF3048 domain-containing protein [Candidatus Saccharibacteria bacterium]
MGKKSKQDNQVEIKIEDASAPEEAPEEAEKKQTKEEAPEEAEKKQTKEEVQRPHEQSDDEVFDPKIEEKYNEEKTKAPAPLIQKKRRKRIVIIISIIVLLLVIGVGVTVFFLFFYHPNEPEVETKEETPEVEIPKYYSKFTGLEIADDSLNSKPLYCIQIPNGIDGARPQTGLNAAGVIFEAIAEAGITRFAAIFQNPGSSVIGPIRSLRSYYLSWDTPFDCTIVHAGGSADASAEVSSGRYRDLNESLVYMWRNYNSYWAPNNLMTSGALLSDYNNSLGYTTSSPAVFPRLKPAEANEAVKVARKKAGLDKQENPESSGSSDANNAENTEETTTPLIKEINLNFGYVPAFNVHYVYNEDTNSYLRSYQNGQEHISYDCPAGMNQPDPKTDCGAATQLSPSVVVAMMVDEYLDTDGYHHVIQTIGSGVAYIFQNGTAEKGTWVKNSKEDQITFKDSTGNVISFTPGQIIISALPNSTGSISY